MRVEMLRAELDMVKQEYDVRIGKLYLKSNQQDLDIIYYRNLIQKMDEGMMYQEAVEHVEDTYYAKQRAFEQEQEKIRQEEKIYQKRVESKCGDYKSIKDLWKYLVSKFHPDLVQNPTEKKRREEIMKQLNRAYEERDYEALQELEKEVHSGHYEETTVEKLIELLTEVENEIIHQTTIIRELRSSKWYTWKLKIERAKKRNMDIFADIERNLLNEIVKNNTIITILKSQVVQRKRNIKK